MLFRSFLILLVAFPAIASPEAAERLAEEAQTAFIAGDFEKAVKLLTKAIDEDGGNPGLYANRGSSYDNLGRTEEALRDFDTGCQKLIERTKNPHDKSLAEFVYNRGAALARAGRFAGAITDFEKVLKLDEDFPDVRTDLAWIMATSPDSELRRPGKALEYALDEVKRNGMHSPGLGDTVAAAYAATGKFEDAVRAEKAALERATNILQKKHYSERLRLYELNKPYLETDADRALPPPSLP